MEELKEYLAEQAALVDEAERRLGGRPAWVVSPTSRHPRSLAVEAGGNADRMITRLVTDLETLVEDIRLRVGATEGEWSAFLAELADGLAVRAESLTTRPG